MKKLVSAIVILCLVLATLVSFVACNKDDEMTATVFEKAINDLGGYTITTRVEASNGIVATITEKVTVSGDNVTVESTKNTPNSIGSETQYTTSTETKTYPLASYSKFALKLSVVTAPVIGEDGTFSGTFAASQAKDACGIDANYKGDVSVRVSLDANRLLQTAVLSYQTNGGNTVTVTVVP